MPDKRFGDLAKNYQLPVGRNVSLTNRRLLGFHESRRMRRARHNAASRRELTVSPPLRTVTALIVRVQESHTCPRMTPSIYPPPEGDEERHPQGSSQVLDAGALLADHPRRDHRTPGQPVVTSRQPSSRRRTIALTPGMRSSCSRVGGAATTSCASTGQPDHDCSGTWTGSWRSSAWLTGSKDLSPSQSHPQTPKKPIPAWRGAFLSEVSAAESQKQ